MPFYTPCHNCGGNLDPGESYNCEAETDTIAEVCADLFDCRVDPVEIFALSF
ncbi:MAG: hypothetical protein GXY32_11480 [Ruminococcaceae bacterium]|nr:hypothetical protein [Oscillospiraceae bacterium]